MPAYAVGDVQGCLGPLRALLDRVGFAPGDRLWLVGDLVNRGEHSVEVLRLVRDLGERAVTVLGNHDLHLLAVAAGVRKRRRKDTFGDVLEAPDRDDLLDWLRRRPLLHRDRSAGWTMVHAGLPPQWSLDDAEARAAEVEAVLRGPDPGRLLRTMYGDQPNRWSDSLAGDARRRLITNCLTRIRYCDAEGRLSMDEKGPPGTAGGHLMPWFEVPGRRSAGERIVFGHWATLQLERPVDPRHGVHHLDTGCAWGGALTALRLEDAAHFSVDCAGARR